MNVESPTARAEEIGPAEIAIPPKRSWLQDLTFSQAAILISVAVFATGLAQPQVLGKLPLADLLKNRLHVQRTEFSLFFFLCTVPWFLKPLAGVLSDAFPLFGTRRRSYLLASGVLSAVSWLALLFVPHAYGPLLALCITVNVFMMVASTVAGAVLIEAGRSMDALGRFTSLRIGVQNVIGIAQGPLGGAIASAGLATLAGVNSAMLITLVPVTYFFLRERPEAVARHHAFNDAGDQIKTLVQSKPLWWTILFLALFYFAPGFATPQFYRQQDEFKLSIQSIGFLTSVSCIAGLAIALAFARLCRKWDLRVLIGVAIAANALGNFFYLMYSKNFTADALIEAQSGIFYNLVELGLYTLAARATPVGCEAMGYALIIGVRNFAVMGADVVGSKMIDHHVEFWKLISINSATTVCVLLLLPLLPRALVLAKDSARPAQT